MIDKKKIFIQNKTSFIMNTKNRKILLFLIFFPAIINGMEITEKEVEAYMGVEFNRSFNYYGDLSAIGAVELDNIILFRGGLSVGKTGADIGLNTFIGAKYYPFQNFPLHFKLSWIYNGLPEYEAHTHTILPVISFNASRAGISAGLNFRFTSYFSEIAEFETVLSFYAYFNFINSDDLRIGVGAGNFSDFYAKNMGAYSLNLNAAIALNSNWSIVCEFEFMQSGGDGLAANFYGFAWRGGAKYSW
jgi:hypothetical protein